VEPEGLLQNLQGPCWCRHSPGSHSQERRHVLGHRDHEIQDFQVCWGHFVVQPAAMWPYRGRPVRASWFIAQVYLRL